MNIKIAYSPCPNDTFIFDALVHKKIESPYLWDVSLEDIKTLNQWAFESDYDVIKLSFHAFGYLTEKYQLLPYGSALGVGVGPLLISNKGLNLKELEGKRIGIPGEFTTANFLFDFASKVNVKKKIMLFSDIEDAIQSGAIDAGVIIHENRFTYQQKGFVKLLDLGEYWESKTKLPIPLGGIAVLKSLPLKTKLEISQLLSKSINYAFDHPELVLPYVKSNAQSMDPVVMKKHIDLYVNEFTRDLTLEGVQAIDFLLDNFVKSGKIKTYNKSYMLNS